MHPDVDVYEGDTKTLRGGEASVTSFRVMYRQTGDGVVFAARLADVAEAERVSGYIVRSPKVKFTFSDGSEVRFSFQQGGQPEFWSHLDSARRRKSWEAAARVRAAKKQRPTFSTARAGVAGARLPRWRARRRLASPDPVPRPVRPGLIRSQQQQQQSRAQVASEAFSDLESLMAMARDVVAVCNAVAAEHDKQRRQRAQRENSQPSSSAAAAQGQAGAAGGAAASDAEGASLGALLRDVGLSSPVTREAAGALFHRELARQLASFLRAPMAAAGGTMTLTDVYCLYNRARGTDLVSPLDVRRGCELLPQTGAPFALRTFPSGVVVVTDDIQSPCSGEMGAPRACPQGGTEGLCAVGRGVTSGDQSLPASGSTVHWSCQWLAPTTSSGVLDSRPAVSLPPPSLSHCRQQRPACRRGWAGCWRRGETGTSPRTTWPPSSAYHYPWPQSTCRCALPPADALVDCSVTPRACPVLAAQDAERRGTVCRDECTHGVRFYPNRFV